MHHYHGRRIFSALAVVLALSLLTTVAWGQHGSEGKVSVTVLDPQQAVVAGAKLTLVDQATNRSQEGITSGAGTFTFVNLPIGLYKLTVAQPGFAPQVIDVIVQAAKTTDVEMKLAVGAQAITVEVQAAAPVLETTTNAISQVIDPKQIETLPISGRDLTQLSRLAPGYNGTWQGLPTYAQGSNVDGVVGGPTRMKFSGAAASDISPRLENMEEMTVQTDLMDTNQGFGQAAMQIGYITRRGSNTWHGRVYEDFRNDWLNANSWSANASGLDRTHRILNDFGGSAGGPILKNKLFFFGSLATSRQPGKGSNTSIVFTPAAQAGNFTYAGADGTHTINLFQVAQAYNASLPGTVNSAIAAQLTKINSSLSSGSVNSTADPIINNLSFQWPQPITNWYETLRVDYDLSSRLRMNLALNRRLFTSPGDTLPAYPSPAFGGTMGGNTSDALTAAYGLDWTITPRLINQLKVGWNYNSTAWAYNSNHGYFQDPFEWWWPFSADNGNNASGRWYQRPINTYYPITNISDTLTAQRGAHNLSFGFSFVREHDHYWNGPEGIGGISLGLNEGDPALAALTNAGAYNPLPGANTDQQAEAQNLYATLTGRISSITGLYSYSIKAQDYFHGVSAFPLNEVASAWGLFGQDSWRLRPNLTVNYGLRWDFTGDDYDRTSEYHNAGMTSIFGPTAPGDLFKPGALNGNLNPTLESRPHAYNGWKVAPQPTLGFAWNVSHEGGILGKLIGKDATVIRGGYGLRRFSIPYQYVWNYASNCGSFYYQNFALNAGSGSGAGTFAPGSLALGNTLPPYAITPATFQKVAPESQFTFTEGAGGSCGINVTGIKPDIGQPYIQSWNFGIQRQLGKSRVLEVRYSGNRGLKEWVALNTNEINTFENGFLKEFQNAQNNLRINGGSSFANLNPSGGTVAVPIMTAAFTGSTTGAQTNGQFSNGTFINYLNNGRRRIVCRAVDYRGRCSAVLLQSRGSGIRALRYQHWLHRRWRRFPHQLLPGESVCGPQRDQYRQHRLPVRCGVLQLPRAAGGLPSAGLARVAV